MYRIRLIGVERRQDYDELIRLFLRPDEYRLVDEGEQADETLTLPRDWAEQAAARAAAETARGEAAPAAAALSADQILAGAKEGETPDRTAARAARDRLARELYRRLSARTGLQPPWGILTGIRPVKLAGELLRRCGRAGADRVLRERCLLRPDKSELALSIYQRQTAALGLPPPQSAGLYVGIPFCPTRCLYCSFASNQVPEAEIARYLEALEREIRAVGPLCRAAGIRAESLYIGGGTPTTLTPAQLQRLLELLREEFDGPALREITVEAGRPDTITEEKLRVLRDAGVGRISVNPQTLHQATLERIGRAHTAAQFREAAERVRTAGFDAVNMDLIAGLPGETTAMFLASLDGVLALAPENITVHSLAVKRSSRLRELDPDYHYRRGAAVTEMLEQARQKLAAAGYRPYYLYRQKHMSGAQENTGYALPGWEGLYNVRIMDEHQHIIAMGAGGISKVFFAAENRLERVPNVTNYQIYIERIEEMIRRKQHAYQRAEGNERCTAGRRL
ncbi:MAG: coproporphyrinogen dehydrogenase HemZ [Anaerovoracaceae bacterium]